MIFLTEEELEYMTGLKQPAAQIRWLQKWKIDHTVSAAGRPRVTVTAVQRSEAPKTKPNFAALEKAS